MQHLSVVDIGSPVPGRTILVSTFLFPAVDFDHLVLENSVPVVDLDFLVHDFSVPAYTNFQLDHNFRDPSHCFLYPAYPFRRLDNPRLEIRAAKKVPDVV